MERKIIQIDEEKCNGCGLCTTACAEGALAIVDGKARLISDEYCDGLGNCLPACPQDALHFVVREAAAFNEEAVKKRMGEPGTQPKGQLDNGKNEVGVEKRTPLAGGCPGAAAKMIRPPQGNGDMPTGKRSSEGGCPGTAAKMMRPPHNGHYCEPGIMDPLKGGCPGAANMTVRASGCPGAAPGMMRPPTGTCAGNAPGKGMRGGRGRGHGRGRGNGCGSPCGVTELGTPSPMEPAPGVPCGAPPEMIRESKLAQWPVQIDLTPTKIHGDNLDILIAADCTAYAYGDFHDQFMDGRITLIGCPKLDGDYTEKLTQIFKDTDVHSITVTRMEVPCCAALDAAVRKAAEASGKDIEVETVIIGTDGCIR